MLGNSYKAVLFDFGDTLVSTKPSYFNRIAISFRECGYLISNHEVEMAYINTDYEIHKRYIKKGSITPQQYGEWFFPILCKNLSIEGDLIVIREKISATLNMIGFTRFVLPGGIELLELLKEHRFTLGIISNNDGRTEAKCEEVSISSYFDIIADSTKLGISKPDSRIFHYVLDKLGIPVTESIYIGDLYGSDVLGGLNAGLEVIWFNGRRNHSLDDKKVQQVIDLTEIRREFAL